MDASLKKQLKAQAHHLKPVVMMGSKGLTDALTEEASLALNAHELIKVKISGLEKVEREAIAIELCDLLKAHLIQLIGNTAVIYRPNPENGS